MKPQQAQAWDLYWARAEQGGRAGWYERIAKFYRDQIISRAAARILCRHFTNDPQRRYLHAGCGSGGSDQRIPLDRAGFHFLDLSPAALGLHARQSLRVRRRYVCGDLFRLPYAAHSMDGIFNFGVMEHFTLREIWGILAEFKRVLRPEGRLVLFWPPNFGLSVMALTSFQRVVNLFRRNPLQLHPAEISRVRSFGWVRRLMGDCGWRVLRTEFGPGDLFTYVAVVASPHA